MAMYSGASERKLAIVIPAYKITYLRETLQSLADQTCQSFRVYIGDDGSPHDLASVVRSFSPLIDVVYQRFDLNLGGRDLVAHWERCIDMTGNEEWIWFFSDDDTMDPTCVERFYEQLPEFEGVDLVHFNVRKIDDSGRVIEASTFPDFPVHYRIEDFCRDRLAYAQQSYVVEFVFRKSKFYDVGRFQKFDLAWGTDVSTCIKLGHPGGITSISGANVFWRVSDQNISPNNSREMVGRKLAAVVDFFEWLDAFSRKNGIRFAVSPITIYLRRWFAFRGKLGIKRTLSDLLRLFNFRSAAQEMGND